MTSKAKILPFDGCVELISQVVDDFVELSKSSSELPLKKTYKVASSKEPTTIGRSARLAALKEINNNTILNKYAFARYDSPSSICQDKIAFDTRRIDQENTRNPRANLQYWNRSQQFVDDQDTDKLNTFAKLLYPLKEIKNQFGNEPEYFESYSRILGDLVSRIVQVDKEDVEVFKPQLAYLEQLLFARYRLSLNDINKMSKDDLKAKILQKDEHLLKRGKYQNITGSKTSVERKPIVNKDGNIGLTQDSIVSAIFGNNDFRRDGESKVERTITITIRDEVME